VSEGEGGGGASAAETGKRLQELLTRLDETLAELERADDSEQAVDRLSQMAELAREVQAEIDRLRRETPDAPA
jgi:primosomal protein N''